MLKELSKYVVIGIGAGVIAYLVASMESVSINVNESQQAEVEVINNSYILIDELEYDLKKKLSFLGIDVTREQIRVMTTRVDGDELAKSFAIFDVGSTIHSDFLRASVL